MPSGGAFLQEITLYTAVFSESFILTLKESYGDLPFEYLMLDSEYLHFLFCKDWLNKTINILPSSALRETKCSPANSARPNHVRICCCCRGGVCLHQLHVLAMGEKPLVWCAHIFLKHLNYSIAKHLLWILRNSGNEISSLRVSLRFLIYLIRFAFVCIFNNLLLFYF